jgi:hypothetical protein
MLVNPGTSCAVIASYSIISCHTQIRDEYDFFSLLNELVA